MKRTDLKEKSSVFFIGRGFITISIIIISSLSFTLGYFVGKNTRHSVDSQASFIPAQQDTTEKKNTVYEGKEIAIPQSGEMQQSQENHKPQETQETQEIEKVKENIPTESQPTPKIIPKTKDTNKVRAYTVQAGAFKHVPEADALKTKLDKKGYKTYVMPSKTKKHQKLYKVMIGEFVTRKEADVLSAKIRETEGLKTFVTIKTVQEDLR
jgi:cell division septation protein DedD